MNSDDRYREVAEAVRTRKRRRRKTIVENPVSKNGQAIPFKLDLGCGGSCREGYVGVDRKDGGECFPLKLNDGSPVADSSVDEIVASHVLEHFSHGQVSAVVMEWARVLKPGGWLKVAVPDLQWIARTYLSGHPANIQGFLMGGQEHENDFHKTAMDAEVMKMLFDRAGLVDMQRWKSDQPDCSSYAVSLNVMARKPKPIPKLNIGCAMSVPRLGFQDNFFCWAEALIPHGIAPQKYDGAYWGQCLERVMTEFVDQGKEWILTVDYDSIFNKEQVGGLFRLADEYPEADAIAAMQMSRGRDTSKPLLVIRKENGEVQTQIDNELFWKPLLKVQTAHFGLTLINCEKLKKMPHPWFRGTPAPDGQWGEGRIDDDIHFWHEWERMGYSCYVANRIVIGHAELMITWPDAELNPIHQYPSNYHEHGVPDGVWE